MSVHENTPLTALILRFQMIQEFLVPKYFFSAVKPLIVFTIRQSEYSYLSSNFYSFWNRKSFAGDYATFRGTFCSNLTRFGILPCSVHWDKFQIKRKQKFSVPEIGKSLTSNINPAMQVPQSLLTKTNILININFQIMWRLAQFSKSFVFLARGLAYFAVTRKISNKKVSFKLQNYVRPPAKSAKFPITVLNINNFWTYKILLCKCFSKFILKFL